MATLTPIGRIPLAQHSFPPAPEPASPFVKWVGGKGRILSQLRPLLPQGVEFMRHVEPFIGGGAMFFSRQPRRALLCDINLSLITTYEAVRDEVERVIAELEILAASHNETFYYKLRRRYNRADHATSASRAAMFIYLNKTCFNGLHRVNRRGEFNVPIGRYKNPNICNADGLRAASVALQEVDLHCTGFEELLRTCRPGDFVYFDPPYEPLSRTSSFTSYATDGFAQEDQARLRDVYQELDRRGCKLMLSNSDVPFIRELYGKFHISSVAAPRAINCDAKKRGRVSEVVVRNY